MEIHWIHLDEVSDRQREEAEERLRALEGHDLIDVRVAGQATGHHRHGDREVSIVCLARDKELVVKRNAPDLGVALNDALDVFEREVRRLRDRRTEHRPEPPNTPPYLGVVDRVLDGYGFILTDGGEQVYFHQNAVKEGLRFEALREGDRVALNVEAGDKGPQATVVCAPLPGTPAP